jgi:hypothetical protein
LADFFFVAPLFVRKGILGDIALRNDYSGILRQNASAVKKIHLIEVRRQKPATEEFAGFFCLDFYQRKKRL